MKKIETELSFDPRLEAIPSSLVQPNFRASGSERRRMKLCGEASSWWPEHHSKTAGYSEDIQHGPVMSSVPGSTHR